MKKYLSKSTKIVICCFSVIFLFQICNAQITQADSNLTSLIIDSKVLGEKNKIFINIPPDYYSTTEKYPIIYVLDGEYNFKFSSEAAKLLYQNERIPPCIVIGITTNNRDRDFTTAGDNKWQPPREMQAAGGADKFLKYLEEELIPAIEAKYRIQPYRVIIGHSLGGLLAMYAFSAKPYLFQAYISLEGSLWWNNGAVGKSAINYLTTHPEYKGKLFIGRIKIPREAWFPINVTLIDYLEKNRPAGLDYKYMEMEDETHSTMVFPGTYFGLRDIFSDYFFELNENANDKSIMDYYTSLSAKYGYTVTIPQQIYNFLWDISMNAKKYNEAVNYGEMRIKYYPNSYRAYMDLGNTYIHTGNKELAIIFLTKASKLNPNDESVKQMLNDVLKK
jgi:predicted alpha/beta superfamily hydrolase